MDDERELGAAPPDESAGDAVARRWPEVTGFRERVSLEALLLSYAWLIELTHDHLRRLHFADRSTRTVNATLQELTAKGWIARRDRGLSRQMRPTSDAQDQPRSIPGRLPAVWSLTPNGHAQYQGAGGVPVQGQQGPVPGQSGQGARRQAARARSAAERPGGGTH
jgi:hypothetical protein